MMVVQLPQYRFGVTEYIADLRLGEFRAVGNFIVAVQFASERGRQFCRMAGIMTCPQCNVNVIVSEALRDEVLGCVRCGEVLAKGE